MSHQCFAVGLLLLLTAAEGLRARSKGPEWDAPDPSGAPAPKLAASGAFASQADACHACKVAATGSCAMYKTCICYATNSFFGVLGADKASEENYWHWACGNEGGEKYKLCFTTADERGQLQDSDELYKDNFGDMQDPNKPVCPE